SHAHTSCISTLSLHDALPILSSGSEADLYAMRAARAFMRRDKILKFEGGYHGMSDYSLMSLAPKRSGNFPAPVPDNCPSASARGDRKSTRLNSSHVAITYAVF